MGFDLKEIATAGMVLFAVITSLAASNHQFEKRWGTFNQKKLRSFCRYHGRVSLLGKILSLLVSTPIHLLLLDRSSFLLGH